MTAWIVAAICITAAIYVVGLCLAAGAKWADEKKAKDRADLVNLITRGTR